ncbi:ComC/BlpC family leader-containing pheromone/bacteriocin [Streptococcus equinus]|uniref:ComC/BlpC family leader-containing pheromone/bacteriocin n=1 Tax=Streptococcus equinus TaxID=1335 RepID=UPI000B1F3C13|nr:ComC/BlpC family leader-containing pheromone/bacteriocin [Streptococcus equinus]GEB10656.1 hypothetical protein SEQ01_08470 [Streptococcus equinus]
MKNIEKFQVLTSEELEYTTGGKGYSSFIYESVRVVSSFLDGLNGRKYRGN